MQPGRLNPMSLPPGAHIGPWCIVDARGSGTYGSVYLTEALVPEATGLVALKLAHHPRNEPFFREAELLSRIRHPAVPRLIEQGQWISPAGQPHPYLALELVDGIPLYAWAQALAPSSRQVLRVLAELAGALAATHAVGGVHRDVKGDNALVRLEDGQPFLIDFGSGTYEGAAPLTPPVFPPGTEPYRSPEAFRFGLNILNEPVKVYAPGPAEDVFALGVTAYKLVTGEYPPRAEPTDAQAHVWKTEGPGPRPARELNPRCSPELSALISRMLSRQPEARGSASELAEALAMAASEAGPEADAPLFHRQVAAKPAPSQSPHRSWGPWLAAASLVGPVVLSVSWMLRTHGRDEAAQVREDAKDADTAAIGDSLLTASAASPHEPAAGTSIALDMPDKPLPGQLRPDANGRCRFKPQVPINGGCWIKVNLDLKDCKASDLNYVYNGACYQAVAPFPPPATSAPTESRDGG